MDRYKPLGKVGAGTYGVVYKGMNTQTNELVALKRIKLTDPEEGVPATAIREISLLKDLQHQNIVPLNDVIYRDRRLYLIFPFLDQDLQVYMHSLSSEGRIMEPMILKSLLHQMLSGIAYCHENRVLHRDLKPQNLLIDKGLNLKLADFGLARAFSVPLRRYTKEVVTLWYRPPEILLGGQEYTGAIDVWAVACIFVEMYKLRPLFPGDSEIDELFRIFRILGTPTEATWPGVTSFPFYQPTFPHWSPKPFADVLVAPQVPQMSDAGVDLLASMLKFVPEERITCQDALSHEFFDDVALPPAAGYPLSY